MFTQLAVSLPLVFPGLDAVGAANLVLTGYRPSQLSEFLEALWSSGQVPGFFWELPPPDQIAMSRPAAYFRDAPPPPPTPFRWYHLVYAYMLENMRVVDIFRRVVYEYAHGEKLPVPSPAMLRWLRATEELFFTSPRPESVYLPNSNIRPDGAGIRRNAYYRVLGMDLNHGTDDGRPYPYVKPEAANRGFPEIFEALLREVWKGYANRNNLIGENPTDDEAIRDLVRRLREMLTARRQPGTLFREEFYAVAALSWFHLTLEYNTGVVNSLGVQATSFAERLRKVGNLVGLPPHARSDAYFQMAIPMSNVLLAIESGVLDQILAPPAGAQALYQGLYAADVQIIIAQWSIATGRSIKEGVPRVPAAVPRPGVPAGAGDGRGSRIGTPVP